MTAASADWEAGVLRLHSEAAGAYELLLVEPADIIGLAARAAAGDGRALAYIRVLKIFAERTQGLRRDAPLCLTCDQRLWGRTRPAVIGLFHAWRDDAAECMAIGVCWRCAGREIDQSALSQKVIVGLRRVFPDLQRRDAVMAPSSGRA